MQNRTWRPLAPDAVTHRSFEDELVLYNDVTGSTHYLSVLGRSVMLTILANPSGITLDALVRRAAEDVHVEADGDLAKSVEGTLAELSNLRLVASTS